MPTPEPSPHVMRSWELAKTLRAPWEGRWQRLVAMAMPYRTQFFGNTLNGAPPLETLYDDTGLTAIEEMAARLQTGIMPAGVQWGRIEGDPQTSSPELQRGLAEVQAYMFTHLDRSNFGAEISDAFKDLSGFGNCCIRITPGDWSMPVRAMAIPLANAWITPGADGMVGDIHVIYSLPAYAVQAQWPGVTIPEEVRRQGHHTLRVVDSWIRNLGSEVEHWQNEVHIEGKVLLVQREHSGAGTCPYVFGRWSKAAGELYATGQGMLALPSMEALNETRRLILAHGEMALAGMWQAEDDGVLNPWTVKLEPGTIIPIAPGSKGLMPVQHPGSRVDLGLMELDKTRLQIRKTLFNDQLGPNDGRTPPTAFEVQARQADLARQIGPAYHRVWCEMAVPLLVRLRRVLLDQGRIVMPLIDGKRVKVSAASSMVKAQAIEEVQRVKQGYSDVAALFGPQALQMLANSERFVKFVSERYDMPPGLWNTQAEIQQGAQQMGQAMGQAQGAGMDPSALLGMIGGGAKAG